MADESSVTGDGSTPGGGEGSSGFYNRRAHMYPLIKFSDMNEEMRVEAMELCVTACEKHSNSNESAAKMIKETMDKKFGPAWHTVVGMGFGFELTHDVKNLLYMFFGSNTAICLWKCA